MRRCYPRHLVRVRLLLASLLVGSHWCATAVNAQTLLQQPNSPETYAVDSASCPGAVRALGRHPFLVGGDPQELRDSIRASAGQLIRAVYILPLGLAAPMDELSIVRLMHATTRAGTIRNLILFAPGDTLDSLVVAETMRVLQHTRFLADAGLSIARCTDGRGLAVTVTTRDAWSVRATLKLPAGSGASAVALEESNLLGTGRSARVYTRTDNGRTGVGASYTDPWLGGSRSSLTIARNIFRDGGEWFGGLRTRDRSLLDPWRAELSLSRATPGSLLSTADTVQRDAMALLVERRLFVSSREATVLLAGVEARRTLVTTSPNALLVGPSSARRSFLGLDLGLARRSRVYSPVAGLLGGDRHAELPKGFESEVLLGVGGDAVTRAPALHADLWAGRIWMPGGRVVLSGDAWASGFRSKAGWQAATARASLLAVRPFRSGVWSARMSVEMIVDPDPDTRALTLIDPTVSAYPSRGLSEEALAVSLERSHHLTDVHHGYALDLAGFALGSMRWDPATPSGSRLFFGALGTGVRLNPATVGRPIVRIDVGLPVLHAHELGARPFVRISFTPWIEAGRHRDGRR